MLNTGTWAQCYKKIPIGNSEVSEDPKKCLGSVACNVIKQFRGIFWFKYSGVMDNCYELKTNVTPKISS